MRVTGSHPERPREAGHPAPRLSRSALAWLVLALTCLIATPVLPAGHVTGFGGKWVSLPLLAIIFVALAWQANRMSLARQRARLAAETQRLLLLRRQSIQDASHQLRTPITIALGRAERLAAVLTGPRERDIRVVVAELRRLQAVSDRLLLTAGARASATSPDDSKPARVCS